MIEKLHVRTTDFSRVTNDVIRITGETYFKFLVSGKLRIRIDGVDIEPVDPLHRDYAGTTSLFRREELKFSDGRSIFFSAVALPHPNQVPVEVKKGFKYQQKYQGIYVFRNGRMIAAGETFDLFQKDFHLNNFRAEIEYTSNADDMMNVDIAKTSVVMDPAVRAGLQEFVRICTNTADTLWREKDVLTPDDVKGIFDESNRLISSRVKLLVEIADGRRAAASGKGRRVPRKEIPYLSPKDSLSGDVLYRPVYDGVLAAVVVEVNLSHPFSKAVFAGSVEEGKRSVPRKATTAVQ